MSVTGLNLEGSAKDDLTGVFSMVVLTYLFAPFQGYAALKGMLEQDEGGWIRTLKTGSITEYWGAGGEIPAHVDLGGNDIYPRPGQRIGSVDA